MRNSTAFLLFFFAVIFRASSALFCLDIENHEVAQYVYNLSRPEAPRTFNEYLVFSQAPDGYTRYVGIAFAHEDYKRIHVFHKNRYDVFFFIYPVSNIPDELKELQYRLVSDGIWMTDPMVGTIIRDERGIRISVLRISGRAGSVKRQTGPAGNGYVDFYLNAAPAGIAYVMGDFNRWNPFMHKMEEIEPGLYTTRVRMSPGPHAYIFVVNGHTIDTSTLSARPEDRVYVSAIGIRAILVHVH